MLHRVRQTLQRQELFDERIINAMNKIDRKNFIDSESAYLDIPLPIGEGQTISQPSTVAVMLSLLKLKSGDKVLEIGTGSGWNAALISEIINPGKVLSLEISKELADRARERLNELEIENVLVKTDDFRLLNEKFNKIIFTAGILFEQEDIIEDFAEEHLGEGGVLVCPYQTGAIMIITKEDDKLEKEYTDEEYSFVPLIL